MKKETTYLSPYIAGFGIGIMLLLAIVVSGRGLGASSALMRTVVQVEKFLAQGHVDNNPYLAKYGGGDKNPWNNWLIFEVIGVLVGGAISGALSGRVKREINHGPQINRKQRLIFSFAGGALFGVGARIARGCTSGVALSGGATLALGSWMTMMVMFAAAYIAAFIVRKLWI